MKILLVYPYCLEKRIHEEEIRVPPIGLYYVGAVLKEYGYDVSVYNLHDMKGREPEIRHILEKERPHLLGISVLHANRWGAIEIGRLAKEVNPALPVVAGGIGATFLWELLLTRFECFDGVVLGEGEQTFLEAAKCIEAGDGQRLFTIPGLAWRCQGRLVCNEAPPPIPDLDALPDPARYFGFHHVVTSRGCPANCKFCGSPRFWGRRVRFHGPDYIVDQLERLARRGIRFFFISDDTFTLRPDRVIEICRLIIDRGLSIQWAAISRVDMVQEEMLAWMRRAGCIQISYGVEHGSAQIRSLLGKKFSNEQILKAFSMTVQHGIMARAYFIYGCPGETDATVNQTIALIRKIRPLSVIFYILDIFPGTALYEEFKNRTGATDDIWMEKIEDILYFETDPKLSREKILAFGKKLRDTFYQELPGFADAIELIEDPRMAPLHADFLSRIGMTFSHGDYARIQEIPDPAGTAERLFRRSISFYPDHRAYLGLGIRAQSQRDFKGSIEILSEAVKHFPGSEELHTCLGINYMNLGRFDRALEHLEKFSGSPNVKGYVEECRKKLGS